ncbi:TorF family putative porin [Phenylobacterium sp.]|uniref:TorF family putative porin n=1 Tax=Phenylobacterium sp. TaxID=1871053 RepID=UPI00273216B1|nr:TorF family putative porin [Phenylobacterium sp.]MDP1616638.1 TorF family putative porin [Phenylobacterium sp.]MDP1988097.1 TorF family putative porin [Phenylobacterium sp.]
MKTLKLALLAAATTVAMGGVAAAQESPVSFNVGVASDYVFRGVSQTDEGPQVFGGVDLAIGEMGYAGVWASNVDFGDDTAAEVDFYAGITPTLGPVSADFAAIYYAYVDAPSGSDYNYWEFAASGTIPAGPAEIGAAVYYSPEFFGGIGDAFYYEVNAAAPLTDKLSVSGALGRQEFDGGGDYTTWNVGLGVAFNDTIGLDLRYHDTDEDALGDIGEGRLVASLTAAF